MKFTIILKCDAEKCRKQAGDKQTSPNGKRAEPSARRSLYVSEYHLHNEQHHWRTIFENETTKKALSKTLCKEFIERIYATLPAIIPDR